MVYFLTAGHNVSDGAGGVVANILLNITLLEGFPNSSSNTVTNSGVVNIYNIGSFAGIGGSATGNDIALI